MIHNTKTKLLKWGVALSATAVLIAGCSAPQEGNQAQTTSEPQPAPTSSVTLNAAGATFPYPLYSKWFDAYKEQTGVAINYQPVGSGAGIRQIKNQTVDFGATDAPVDDKELTTMPKPMMHLPMVAGAVVVSYNLPELEQPLKLDGAALADIFLGKIKKWDDPKIAALNSGVKLPSLPVVVGHRSDGSGTSFIFTSYLSEVSSEWKEKVGVGKSVSWPTGVGGKGNSGVAGIIKQSPGSIGYMELAYAEQNALKYASIRNKAGNFVAPSVEATTAAAAGALDALKKDVRATIINAPGDATYPIASFTYLLVYEDTGNAEKAQALKDFLNWALTSGQEMAKELTYAPLPDAVVTINQEKVEKIH